MKNKTTNKKSFPKGYWSRKGRPTQKALEMFFSYLTYRPKDWDEKKGRNKEALQKTREYFGVNYGIECMLTWGINFGCKDSETSSERYRAMTTAHDNALGLIGQGFYLNDLKLN